MARKRLNARRSAPEVDIAIDRAAPEPVSAPVEARAPFGVLSRRGFVPFLLAVCTFFLARQWALATPSWLAPDEPAHFNYIVEIAEQHRLPVLRVGDYSPAAMNLVLGRTAGSHPLPKMRHEFFQPPLYYMLATPVYAASKVMGLGERRRVVALRLFSCLLAALLVATIYRIARAAFPQLPWVAVPAAAFATLLPMHLAIASSISNDNLSNLVIALILLLSIERVRERVPTRRFIALAGVLVGVAFLSKASIYPLAVVLPAAAEALLWWRERRALSPLPRVKTLALIYAISLAIGGWWFIRNVIVYGNGDFMIMKRHDAMIHGYQYMTATMIKTQGLDYTMQYLFNTTVNSFFGIFAWMDRPYPPHLYWLFYAAMMVASFGAVLRARGQRALRPEVLLLLLVLLAQVGLHVMWTLKFVQPQGRQLFPALAPIAIFVAVGIAEVASERHRRAVLSAFVAAMGWALWYGYHYVLPTF